MTKQEPRILVWDIETAPMQTYSFNFYYNTNQDMIIQEDSLICFAYKELGKKGTKVVSVGGDPARYKNNPYDDTFVVKELHKVLSQADAIIHHYGDKFDRKRANDFFIRHNLPPLKDTVQIDTYKIAKKHFHFKSNKLDYIGEFLGVGRKIKTSFKLWKDCMEGDVKALAKMEKYNKQDVELLEKVYLRLRPFTPARFNLAAFYEIDHVCPACGSSETTKYGTKMLKTGKQQVFRCKTCAHIFTEKYVTRTTEVK